MIEKNRLEELIKKEATIYTPLKDGEVGEKLLYKTFYIGEWVDEDDADDISTQLLCNCTNCLERNHNKPDIVGNLERILNEFYETKEEAQWHADNDRERTEYFRPPTWEEFEKEPIFQFCVCKDNEVGLYTLCKSEYPTDIKDNFENEEETLIYEDCLELHETFINKRDEKIGSGYFLNSKYTKENYIKAVQYARKLFEGEE